MGHKSRGKRSVCNLQYGTRSWLVRGMYEFYLKVTLSDFIHRLKNYSLITWLWSKRPNDSMEGSIKIMNLYSRFHFLSP